MAEEKMMRLSLAARKLNVSIDNVVEVLTENGHDIGRNPNAKLSSEQLNKLAEIFEKPSLIAKESPKPEVKEEAKPDEILFFREEPKAEPKPEVVKPEPAKIDIESKLPGLKVVDKIDLDKKPKAAPAKEETPTPVVEKPKVEEPKVEAPKVETPKVEPPKVEAPKVEKPKAEAPKVEPKPEPKPEPVAEKPKVETKVEPKATEAPKAAVKAEPTKPATPAPAAPVEDKVIKAEGAKLQGLKVLGKIELPKASDSNKKRKRKRVVAPEKIVDPRNKGKNTRNDRKRPGQGGKKVAKKGKDEITTADIKDSIKATMARMQNKGQDFGSKYRREKRRNRAEESELQDQIEQHESQTLKVTEFISASELASLMDISVNEIIGEAMKMGMFISINQRLDAETIQLLGLEFDFEVEFISAEDEIEVETIDIEDNEEDLVPRAPIVTIMGHVDHGKTSLLDYIRTTKVASGEAGGITQHIGAYNVTVQEGDNKGKSITFLDTPGHEAFTAMRARGAKITDVAIIVISADDSVMPQTKEAINHAQNAGVPIVFALNKVDKEGANPAKIREDLSKENILVESWGGKFQEQEVSAKTGLGINELLDKVLLEAELLELKANPERKAVGTVIEASLDKGRGYVSTILVEKGTLKVQDIILAGQYYGRVRAMVDDLGKPIKSAGPATPVQILGLPGAPQAGDKFNIMESDREAREIANKREQIIREQSIRAKKHITLDEIGRRKAIGSFEELNVIVKGDVDGSVEALSDSLLKLSTDEVQVRIIHKGVGQISESDVLLASAADAIIIGFQVRPSMNARKIADSEEIEIRLYSIIYDAINEIKDAMEGLLAPKEEEVIVGNVEIREVFKISKVGTIAGCYVLDGYIKRNNGLRIIRDGIVVHEGTLAQLKRFKDDVSEVKAGYECGMSFNGFNNIEVGDHVESYETKETKRKL